MKKTNFARDILTCIKRYYIAIERLESWLKSGGKEDLKLILTLEGDSKMPKHPILDYSRQQMRIFIQCFGDPLVSPVDFTHESPQDWIKKYKERRDLMRNTIAMTNNSRFIGLYPPKRKRRKNGK